MMTDRAAWAQTPAPFQKLRLQSPSPLHFHIPHLSLSSNIGPRYHEAVKSGASFETVCSGTLAARKSGQEQRFLSWISFLSRSSSL